LADASDRGSQRPLDAPPPGVEPHPDRGRPQPGPFRPLSHCQGLPVVRKQAAGPAVPGLLAPGCPPTVARLVMAVVVSPFKTVVRRRPYPHVGKEVFKLVPPFADTDAASAVAPVANKSRVFTPLDHHRPDAVLGGPREAVRNAPKRLYLSLQAAATSRVAFRQAYGERGASFTTIAPAHPRRPVLVPGQRNGDQPAEPLAGVVNRRVLGISHKRPPKLLVEG
jgi:hypothetical protein